MNRLTSEQCFTISSYLRTAAEEFKKLADFAMIAPPLPGLRDQFLKQHDEAMALADMFAVADSANLIQEAE